MGYSKKAVKGLGWAGFLQIAVRGITFVKFIIIARFLVPSELGLFGIAILTTSFFESLTETGISAFLVQTQETEEKYVSSAWIVSIVRGILLSLLTILVAYPVSIFFNSKNSFYIILIASSLPLIRGFANPSVAKFQKYLDFDKEFLYRFSISIFDFFISALLIIAYRNSIALVVALIFSTIFEIMLSLLVIKPRPSLVYDTEKIKSLFHFGKWLTLIGSTNYLVQQLDSIIVGRFIGVESLGIYQLAQKFSLQIMIDAGNVFSKVTFPLFSRIKGDLERTKRALYRILIVVTFIFGTMTILLLLFSKEFLLIFVGQKWISASTPLQIFSLTGLITAFMAVITSLFLAHARQDITAKIIIVRLIILAIFIIPASKYFGIIGTSFVSLLSYLLVLPIAIIGLRIIFEKSHK